MTFDHGSLLHSSRRHPKFWFDDGSLFLNVGRDLFKVHKTLLYRHSRVLPTWPGSYDLADYGIENAGMDGCAIVSVPKETNTTAEDVEVLLEHLYHDAPLSPDSSFHRVAAVLRVASPGQLDFPAIHGLSQRLIERMLPSWPEPLSLAPADLKEALSLSVEYQITSVQKVLYYNLVSLCDFDVETSPALDAHNQTNSSCSVQNGTDVPRIISTRSQTRQKDTLSVPITNRCAYLMTQFIDHLSPILFTPATASHMACTNVLANSWMPYVIQPALGSGGLYKPLETLQSMMDSDWRKEGLCDSCVEAKKEEWRSEQRLVWEKLDEWLAFAEQQFPEDASANRSSTDSP